MAKAWKPKNSITYTYYSVDGSKTVIHSGEEGVTEEMILLLKSEDNQSHLQDRYQEENTDYDYMNAQERLEEHPDSENLRGEIADPSADLFRILFPDEENASPMKQKLLHVFEQLTDSQKDLVYDLFGLCKTAVDVANEQNVSYQAIQNRRTKILKRLKKLMKSKDA